MKINDRIKGKDGNYSSCRSSRCTLWAYWAFILHGLPAGPSALASSGLASCPAASCPAQRQRTWGRTSTSAKKRWEIICDGGKWDLTGRVEGMRGRLSSQNVQGRYRYGKWTHSSIDCLILANGFTNIVVSLRFQYLTNLISVSHLLIQDIQQQNSPRTDGAEPSDLPLPCRQCNKDKTLQIQFFKPVLFLFSLGLF